MLYPPIPARGNEVFGSDDCREYIEIVAHLPRHNIPGGHPQHLRSRTYLTADIRFLGRDYRVRTIDDLGVCARTLEVAMGVHRTGGSGAEGGLSIGEGS